MPCNSDTARHSSFVAALRTAKVPPSEHHVWTQDPQNSDYIHLSSRWRVYQIGTERWEVRARIKEYNWHAVWTLDSPHKAIRFVEMVADTFMQNSRAMHRAAHDALHQVERELP